MASEERAEATPRWRRPGLWLHVLLGALSALGVAAAAVHHSGQAAAHAEKTQNRPIEVSSDGYVSSKQCRSCHPEQYRSWHRSYHRTMTQPATPETVLGPFDGVELTYQGQTARLGRDGDVFYADIDHLRGFGKPGDEAFERVPIVLVTGSHHMQVYWYETGRGRSLGQLPFIYLNDEERYIPRAQAFVRPPQNIRPSETGRWNASCVNCHTTHGQPRLQPGLEGGEGMDTRVAEFGIACEACHGPGREHLVENTGFWARYARHIGRERDPTIVNPRRLDHRVASQICSQCHAIWQFRTVADERRGDRTGFPFRPGETPSQALLLFQPADRAQEPLVDKLVKRHPGYTAGQFWPDGMARVSGREFNGMIESPCYERGELSCLSCHSMHGEPDDPRPLDAWADDQLFADARGDGACTQCHEDIAQGLAEHTRHAPESPGSRCYNCHMPHTSYGLLKAIRTHQVTSPDAQVSLETGRPNACNLCHLDKSLGWTARVLSERFGAPPVELPPEEAEIASAVLLAVRGDAAQRALIAWAMGWEPAVAASGSEWLPPFLGLLMDDPYDAVRLIAHRSLRQLGDFDALGYDSVPAPHTRAPVAKPVAALARERGLGGSPPPAVPLEDGELGATVERLLQQRNQRPVELLE